MSEEKIESLVNSNLKVRVVLKDGAKAISAQTGESMNPEPIKQEENSAAPNSGDKIRERLGRNRIASVQERIERSAVKTDKEQYTYHYGRIFAAGFVIVALLAVLVYVAYSEIKQASERNTGLFAEQAEQKVSQSNVAQDNTDIQATASTEPVSSTVQFADVSQAGDETAVEGRVTEANIAARELNQPSQPTASSTQVASPVAPAEVDNVDPSLRASETQSDSTIQASSSFVTLASKSQSSAQEATASVFDEEITTAQLEPNGANVELELSTTDVTMAQITDKVGANQPIGGLAKVLPLGNPAFKKVYLYTKVNNRQGERVMYRWYKDDRLEAEIPVLLRSNEWGSHTTKNINGQMTGQWRVELVDQSENVLLVGRFQVVR